MAGGGQEFYNEEEAEQILSLASKRTLRPDVLSRERLLAAAAELGLTPEDVLAAETELRERNSEETERKLFLKELKHDFFTHFVSYFLVNLFLLAINLMTTPRHLWVLWVAASWGLGLAFHVYAAFFERGSQHEKEFSKWRRKRLRRLARHSERERELRNRIEVD